MSQEFSTDATEEQKAVARDHWSKTVDDSLDNQTLYDRYSKTAKVYVEATRILNAQGPKELAITTVERFPSNRENLRKQGFKKIDALDGSEGMLEIAREKGLYDRYTLGELGDNTLDAATDTYDAITICALNESVMKRLPIKAYEEIIRVVKKGGYIIWVSHYRVFTDADPEREDMIRHVTSLEAKGKWKRVELRFVSSSIFSEEVTVVFQSTRSASFSAALICIHVLSVLWQY
ncbi:uncharacterized protein LOC124137823 isoform X3 [Haliotis rufescens]|uniref:uncharacterized protein LOC124137823 isoform X3 n=1 Tax=Haliotis rufescens TaxID=6454 RepID=UPI00201F5A2E|nr:uncharacterized protein LOC124137823 isoform X3 [Haliotis rufescens]